MIVCICHGVSDRDVRALVQAGACNVRDISNRCGAGTDCGACVRELRQLTRNGRSARKRQSSTS